MDATHSPQKVDVIDVDDYESSEDKLVKWNVKVGDRFESSSDKKCEGTLESLIKWYKETLFKEIGNIGLSHQFIPYLKKHLQYFHTCFKKLNRKFTDNYLDHMEDILAFFLDYVGKMLVKEKFNEKKFRERIREKLFIFFSHYLLDEEERVDHVLMKMRLNLSSKEAKNYLDNVYRVVFCLKPNDKSDAAYCRAFILVQKWKKIHNHSRWRNTLDKLLYDIYSTSPDSIHSNSIWKEIFPNQDSQIEILAQIEENDKIISDMYFRFKKSNVKENMNVLGVSQKNLDEQSSTCDVEMGVEKSEYQSLIESCSGVCNNENEVAVKDKLNNNSKNDCIIVPEGSHENNPQEVVYEILDDDEDDGIAEIATLKLPEDVEMGVEKSEYQSVIESCNNENEVAVNDELNNDRKDDCIMVPEGSHENNSEEVVYEILDDVEDDGIAEITPLTLSEPLPRIVISTLNRGKVDEEASFADLTDTTNKDSNTICSLKSSLFTINQFTKRMDSVPSPVPNLHNSDDDSEKAREILSRKRKRNENTDEPVNKKRENGANIEAENRNDYDYDAIEKKKIEVTEFFLKHKDRVDRENDGSSPLHLAADIDCLEIIEHGVNINCSCTSISISKGYTPLHCAVENGRKEVVTLLLSRCTNVDVKGEDDLTPLHIAANKGYISIAGELLNHGACIHSLTLKEGYMPVHFASKLGNEEAVKLFLNRGADINVRDNSGKTPIFYAIENADSKITKLLLTNGANIKDSPELLNTAVEKECVEIVEALLQHDADVTASDKDGQTALHFTALNKRGCRNVKVAIAKLLPTKGANADTQTKYGTTPLHHTAFSYRYRPYKDIQVEIAKLLLTKGANVDAQDKYGRTTLHYAAYNCYKNIVKVLLECGADVNAGDKVGQTALYFTVINNNGYYTVTEIAKLLLTEGANANAQTKYGTTPLHHAVRHGYKEVVNVLLEYGADINASDEDGRTALHFTAINNYGYYSGAEIAKLLLTKGANANAKTKYGTTPLHHAVRHGYKEDVKVLLKFLADVNASDKDGQTALHIASQKGLIEVVATLLEYGSDINITNRNNQTALDLAMTGFETREIFRYHIVKMKTAKLYISEKNLQSLHGSDGILGKFQDQCEKEIASMNIEKINNTKISFYDILAKDTISLEMYMRNEHTVQVLKSEDYIIKFPIYASIIERNFTKAMERKKLLEQSYKIFNFLINDFPELPYDCIEKIIRYLSNEDLQIFVDAGDNLTT